MSQIGAPTVLTGGGGGAGGPSITGGTAVADNAIIRGDGTTALQGSLLAIDDNGNIVIEGTTADSFEGNFTFADPTADWTWAWGAAGDLVGAGSLSIDNLKLDGNTISSTDTNGNINVAPNGGGLINLLSTDGTGTRIEIADSTVPYMSFHAAGGRKGYIGFDTDAMGISGDGSPIRLNATNIQINGTDTGLARAAAGVVKVTDGGAGSGKIQAANGSNAVNGLSYGFADDTDTGIYNSGGDNIAFVAGGSLKAFFTTTQLVIYGTTLTGADTASKIEGFTKNVQPKTGGSGSPYSVTTNDDRMRVFTNEGASAETYFTLPTAVAGYEYTFIVQDTDGIRITASAGDTIRPIAGTAASAAAGFIRCATAGAFIKLISINATEWIATGSAGVWTIDI